MTAPPRSAPILELRNVSRSFDTADGPLPVLRNVSLHLQSGRISGIIGPSGSGKTTLLLIAGLLDTPSAGEVRLQGERLSHAGASDDLLREARRRKMGFVFQKANLIPYLTALENVVLSLEIAGWRTSEAEVQASRILTELGLGHRLHSLPLVLSGGEQQRVSIARAVANQPAVIFADEPTAALDANRARQVMELFRKLADERQVAICVVSHDSRWEDYIDDLFAVSDGTLMSETLRPKPAPTDTA
jgi:putative ABC transport system ATP-binding protein